MNNISNDGLSELKAALRKRAETNEDKSRNSSASEINENSSENVETSTDKEEVFVESKIHRKGSKVYKNHGWKYSRSDSCVSSASSQCSMIIIKEDIPDVKVEAAEEMELDALTEKKMSPEEREKYVEQKYNEIIDLLKSVGIEVNNL